MGRWKWKRMLLWGSLVLALLLGSAYYVILSMPGHSYVGTLPPLSADELPVETIARTPGCPQQTFIV